MFKFEVFHGRLVSENIQEAETWGYSVGFGEASHQRNSRLPKKILCTVGKRVHSELMAVISKRARLWLVMSSYDGEL